MNSAQRAHFFRDLWRPACAVQGWDADNKPMRLTLLNQWVRQAVDEDGCPRWPDALIASFNDLSEEQFTEVKSRCLALFKPADVDAQLRQTQAAQKRLQLRWKVNVEAVKLLSAFMDGVNQWARKGQAMRYIEAILRARFKRDEELAAAVDALGDRDLGQLLFTLARTIDAKRRKAGWTDADLRWRAGLGKEEGRMQKEEGEPLPAGAVDENEPF